MKNIENINQIYNYAFTTDSVITFICFCILLFFVIKFIKYINNEKSLFKNYIKTIVKEYISDNCICTQIVDKQQILEDKNLENTNEIKELKKTSEEIKIHLAEISTSLKIITDVAMNFNKRK